MVPDGDRHERRHACRRPFKVTEASYLQVQLKTTVTKAKRNRTVPLFTCPRLRRHAGGVLGRGLEEGVVLTARGSTSAGKGPQLHAWLRYGDACAGKSADDGRAGCVPARPRARRAPAPDHRRRGAQRLQKQRLQTREIRHRCVHDAQARDARLAARARVVSTTRCGLATTRRRCAFSTSRAVPLGMPPASTALTSAKATEKTSTANGCTRATTRTMRTCTLSHHHHEATNTLAFLGDSVRGPCGSTGFSPRRLGKRPSIFTAAPSPSSPTRMPRKGGHADESAFYTGSLRRDLNAVCVYKT